MNANYWTSNGTTKPRKKTIRALFSELSTKREDDHLDQVAASRHEIDDVHPSGRRYVTSCRGHRRKCVQDDRTPVVHHNIYSPASLFFLFSLPGRVLYT